MFNWNDNKFNTFIKKSLAVVITILCIGSISNVNAVADTGVIVKEYEPLELPSEAKNFNFKSYMDYRTLTNKSSTQYKLQQQAYTDYEGFRRIGDSYMIALGTFYSSECGDEFKIRLSNGFEFTAITGDIKADIHTDYNNQYRPMKGNKGNIIEFIVDTNKINRSMLTSGDISRKDDFCGDIVSISKLIK